ncbi:MAG TPA: DUF418 domain-containing protein [Fibrella sp.]
MEIQPTYTVDFTTAPVTQNEPVKTEEQSAPGRQFTVVNVLWGVAVLGLLLVGIRTAGLTSDQVKELWRGPHGGSYQLLKWTHILFDNAMPPLAALLFGAGILRFLARPKTTVGFAIPELYIRAMLWLLLFGIINAFVLLSPTDILFHFGIVAVLLFPLQRLSARGLLIASIVTALFFSGKGYWSYSDQREKFTKYERVAALEKKNKKVKLTDEQKGDKSAWEGMVKNETYDKEKDKKTIATLRSEDYSTTWDYMVPWLQGQQAWQFYQRKIWDIASLMLLGMALFRWGFFTNRLTTGQYAALALGGLLLGQTMAWLSMPSYEATMVNFTKLISAGTLPLADLLQPVERLFSAVGWASLIILLYRANAGTMLLRGLGAIGQMALTNFLLQSVLYSFFFNGYGMSYMGSVRLPYLYLIVAEMWLLQLLFSVVWLRHFSIGPVEWLWKSLTYNRKQPIRLTDTVSATA